MFYAFATRAGRYLENTNRHRVAVWVEDDCRLYPRVTLAMFALVAAEARARIGWLGVRMRNGEPRYGAHLVTFTVVALAVVSRTSSAVLAESDSCSRYITVLLVASGIRVGAILIPGVPARPRVARSALAGIA